MRLHAPPLFDEPEVRALAVEAMTATSRLFNHLLEHHPAPIQAANRDGVEVFRTLVVRHDFWAEIFCSGRSPVIMPTWRSLPDAPSVRHRPKRINPSRIP